MYEDYKILVDSYIGQKTEVFKTEERSCIHIIKKKKGGEKNEKNRFNQ